MKKLSTGQPSTLGSYLANAKAVFGEDSPAVEYLQNKVNESHNGELEEVIADEGQMVMLLGQIHLGVAQ
ncbi:Uncharacterised protein [Ectopseudomonas mendocina]|uniref:Uncharacterized protein n=1 Tax=Ectopseudomonas mendocina TaxID=300 RepID=A0A379PM29_ECTME|nr:hypothetical protein [Pseudomonas mendocina]SUE95827.1 Uncharacterised protein [Pseudomonas mendocina]